jgi:hypothetical protein
VRPGISQLLFHHPGAQTVDVPVPNRRHFPVGAERRVRPTPICQAVTSLTDLPAFMDILKS